MSPEPFVSRAKALPAKRNEKGYGDENAKLLEYHPRTQGLLVGKRATLESSDLKSENIGLPVELRMSSFQKWLNELLAISIVFITNHSRSCNGTFERHSFRQACAVRYEDSRYENAQCMNFCKSNRPDIINKPRKKRSRKLCYSFSTIS